MAADGPKRAPRPGHLPRPGAGWRHGEAIPSASGRPAPADRAVDLAPPRRGGGGGRGGVAARAGGGAARRLDEGDESSTSIRRVVTMGGLELRPTSPTLARVRVDLVMAGGELDFTEAPPLPGGVDVTVRAVMAGMSIRVPRGWRLWSEFSGVGGMGAGAGVQETPEWVEADLRLHARAVFGGIGVESAGS